MGAIRVMLVLAVMVGVMALGGAAFGIDQALPEGHPPLEGGKRMAGPLKGGEGAHGAHGGHSLHDGHGHTEAELAAIRAAGEIAKQDRTAFRAGIDLEGLRRAFVHHNDQLKIMDSWARQSLSAIRNKTSIEGEDPLYTALDMAFRPEAWVEEEIIYVQAVPVRQELTRFAADQAEAQRIMSRATVSYAFLARSDVQELLLQLRNNAVIAPSVNKVFGGQATFEMLSDSLAMVPPPAGQEHWWHPLALQANMPGFAAQMEAAGVALPEAPAGYTAEQSTRVVAAYVQLAQAWRGNDVRAANEAIGVLLGAVQAASPAEYPPAARATVELWYNRTFKGTLIAFVYVAAFALFAVGAMADVKRVRKPAMVLFTVAVVLHLAAMLVRWYLAGRIPIQNQFESVLGAALFGCVLGLVLELWRKSNLYGMAMAFVGFLAMTACFVFPFVIGKDMGATIGKVAGILNNTVWLYIHVNVVIASYALIAASAVLGVMYLGTLLWHWISPLEDVPGSGLPLSDGAAGAGGGMPMLALATPGAGTVTAAPSPAVVAVMAARRKTLEALDGANVVVLQMAFWMLGAGIIFGAIWADVSWGRPWGWDPKETFALVTWIVYLMIIHVRYATARRRPLLTAILSVIGFAVMMFNWVGVNFFLVGLHSYA